MKNSQKGFVVPLLIVIAVLVIGGGVYYFTKKAPASQVNNIQSSIPDQSGITNTNNVSSSPISTDSDLKISYVKIPASNNSASTWNSISATAIAKSDLDFLGKYFGSYSSTNLPPLSQSTALLAKYQSLLATFDSAIQKQYQCSIDMGESCLLNSVRYTSQVAALRAVVSMEQKKLTDAQKEAEGVVSAGKQVTANADDVIPLLVGWLSQKLGYGILNTIHQNQGGTYLAADKKAQLIATLRQEHKTVLKFMYTRYAELVDYITSPSNKPADKALASDEEDQVNTYRKEATASSNAWNPTETKKYFYDSYKIAISNVDLPCGSTPANSIIGNFSAKNTTVQDENYAGKKIYSTLYPSLDNLSVKRCDVENLISSL